MSNHLRALGLGNFRHTSRAEVGIEYVVVQRPLQRIFAFTGYSIDDVVENPVAKNTVLGYYKLAKQISRTSEIVDLERQWNR